MSVGKSTVSIVVPVYGTEQYLERCLNSLLGQSYKNVEIIVVNDGSPGNVEQIMSAYLEDTRVVFVNNKDNKGLLRARVCGAKKATGDYIAFVDSDDYVSFDFYRSLVEKANETDADIVIGKTVWEKAGVRFIYNYHEAALNFEQIVGDQIKETFFGQEYQCYSWHTIWNKLYKKTLWDICEREFSDVKEHIIMTEDIFFSSLLFFNAKKITRVNHDAYFYCVNENASTNSNSITCERFLKNLQDIRGIFSRVERYLRNNAADSHVMKGFQNGRMHYARMWKNLAVHSFRDELLAKALVAVEQLAEIDDELIEHEYFFESVQTPWNGGLEYIKEQIRDSKAKWISFDIFDTLIKRPFYDPRDIFVLLDLPFSELMNNSIAFSKIRIEAEDLARKWYGNKMAVEDITLDEIYEYIIQHYQIPRHIAHEIKRLELNNELRFCEVRHSGKELLQLASALGKRVVLITDMYLDHGFIEKLLTKCNISEYEKIYVSCEERCLKYNGRLFQKVLSNKKISSEDIIHIGDSWKSDIEGSSVVGIKNIFLPKASEVFENQIQGCMTNRCSVIGRDTCGDSIDYEKSSDNIGIRCMKAIVANFYFDNPYRTFHFDSDFNMDPYFMGFYLLGMHALGVAKWINERLEQKKYKQLVFFARDGYFPMKAYSIYTRQGENTIDVSYAQTSRKALMPFIVKDVVNLYQLPIEYRAHTPKTLVELLDFLGQENEFFWKELKLSPDEALHSIEEYHIFINCYLKHCYDAEKHKKSKDSVRKYYQSFTIDCVAFDMGYSGRIQSAICEAINRPIDVLFLHEDYMSSARTKAYSGFSISDFYDYYPSVSGLMREHVFSDPGGSCIGFRESDGNIEPVFEKNRHNFPDMAVVNMLQNGALNFVMRFTNLFSTEGVINSFSPIVASIPFEGFLRKPSKIDMHIFSASYFEDMVYGANEKINIEKFAMNHLAILGWNPKTSEEIDVEERVLADAVHTDEENTRILNMINTSSQIKRAFVWMLLDWKFFKEKMRVNYNRLLGKNND